MDENEEARLRANANLELLRSQPIYTDTLKTADDDNMSFEIWVNISPDDDNEILRVFIKQKVLYLTFT